MSYSFEPDQIPDFVVREMKQRLEDCSDFCSCENYLECKMCSDSGYILVDPFSMNEVRQAISKYLTESNIVYDRMLIIKKGWEKHKLTSTVAIEAICCHAETIHKTNKQRK